MVLPPILASWCDLVARFPIDIVVNFEVFRDHFACVRWWSRNADASFDASRAI
jgi:hypothetical protein